VGDAEIDAELAERAALLDGPARAARAVLADDPGEGWTVTGGRCRRRCGGSWRGWPPKARCC